MDHPRCRSDLYLGCAKSLGGRCVQMSVTASWMAGFGRTPSGGSTGHPGLSPGRHFSSSWWWRQKVETVGVPAAGPGLGVRFSDMDELAPGLELGLLVLVHFSRS